LARFKDSLAASAPPPGLAPPLEALWWQGKGDWKKAHALAQARDDADSARVHAHLHRAEGDLANAAHWYRRAGLKTETGPLEAEWEVIVRALL
jgi:hypothetical protein